MSDLLPTTVDLVENPVADINRIKKIRDPAERARRIGVALAKLTPVATELRLMRQAAVLELRDAGWSYGRIGEALGLHRNRVQQIAEGRSAGGQGGPGGGKKKETAE